MRYKFVEDLLKSCIEFRPLLAHHLLCNPLLTSRCILFSARNEEKGLAACNTLQTEGFKPIFMKLDVTRKSDADKIAHEIKDKYGGLDILINNAGILYSSSQIKV